MTSDERELEKQGVGQETTAGQPQIPPLVDGPDLAETVRLLEKISRLPAVRMDKVQQVRELIAQGKFETPERLSETVKRLMDELGL
jgi:negative regulator of flagellin synthesis FlgM